MKQNKQLGLGVLAIAAIVLIFAFAPKDQHYQPAPEPTSTLAITPQATAFATVSYEGVEGKTALELLEASHEVEKQQFDFGVQVTSIDGQKSDATKYWLYYVDGEQATVGADQYKTKEGETIEWRLEAAQ